MRAKCLRRCLLGTLDCSMLVLRPKFETSIPMVVLATLSYVCDCDVNDASANMGSLFIAAQ